MSHDTATKDEIRNSPSSITTLNILRFMGGNPFSNFYFVLFLRHDYLLFHSASLGRGDTL